MKEKNLLTLHEAIAVVLLKCPEQTASFQTIADEIEKRGLYKNRKGGITLTEQIRLRASIKSSGYKNIFEFCAPDKVRLAFR